MKQQELFHTSKRAWHGGGKRLGRRKTARPLAARKWMHLTLKSARAVGAWSFLKPKNKKLVSHILNSRARSFGVEIKEWVNMGNHLHIKCRFQTRLGFQNFLRTVTALIARKITGAKKGVKIGCFWQGLAFTRILKTRLEELQLRHYFKANRLESEHGVVAREQKLKEFLLWVRRLPS
ncbi:MAG: transposase [Bdellovibrionales bacterium]